jgi:DNA-binding transcriptional ArsR family regulator
MVSYYNFMRMDAVFKALADPVRRQLLDSLHARNGQTLNELCVGHDMTRQAVTKHLALLEAANLVATQRRGRAKLHFLNPVPIQEMADRWIGKYERTRLRALSELKRNLEGKRDGK